jgi:hypothetical protein
LVWLSSKAKFLRWVGIRKKMQKNNNKKVIGRKLLHTIKTERKLNFSVAVSLINFFVWVFLQLFQGIQNQHITFLKIKKHFLIMLALFVCKLWTKMLPKRLKKQNKKFYDCGFELNFATIKGLGEPRKIYKLLLTASAYSSAIYLIYAFSSICLIIQPSWAVSEVVCGWWVGVGGRGVGGWGGGGSAGSYEYFW